MKEIFSQYTPPFEIFSNEAATIWRMIDSKRKVLPIVCHEIEAIKMIALALTLMWEREKEAESEYNIDFGNHLYCRIKVVNNTIEIVGAVNGWGDGVPMNEITITPITHTAT